MDFNEYRVSYADLGEERVQAVEDTGEDAEDGVDLTLEERFFATRLEATNWVKFPGVLKFNRRLRKRIFTEGVSQILMQLEPAVTFNAAEVWKHEINRNKKSAASTATTKTELMKEKNAQEQQNKKFVAEVTKIRNSKSNLLAILRDVKIPEARVILYVQILKNAFEEFGRSRSNLQSKKLLYEVVWALNEMGLPKINAPKPLDNKLLKNRDPSLVFDSFKDAESLLKQANKIVSEEEDLIKLQLVDMSDSLPPLSRFSSGFRLDSWQKRVLTWIDAGKSVVICAPTSSGKTVLSSYVAIIFKSQVLKDEGKEDKSLKSSGLAPLKLMDGSAEDEFDDDEGLEEEDQEYEKFRITHQTSHREGILIEKEEEDFTVRLVAEDAIRRAEFLRLKKELQQRELKSLSGSNQRVLFVVPTEPLVWQVAAYFTKLMKEEGDRQTRVSLVTDQFVFRPKQKIDVVSQIVVGTPLALESALTKPFGLSGREETKGLAAGNILPGGFDHFDWVIYDEVHALDGPEGAALQRLIRAMKCPFLALSATIGNANQLRSWMESVKGEQLLNVEALTVSSSSVAESSPASDLIVVGRSDTSSTPIGALKTVTSDVLIFDDTKKSDLLTHVSTIWSDLAHDPTAFGEPSQFSLLSSKESVGEGNLTLVQAGLISPGESEPRVIEARSGVRDDSMTIVGYSSSQHKLTVQRKCLLTLPAISISEDRKVQDVQHFLNETFPILLIEALKERDGCQCSFSVKTTELKDEELLLHDFFPSLPSKGTAPEKIAESIWTLSDFKESPILLQKIDEFNQGNDPNSKLYPVKLQISVSFESLEIYFFEETKVREIKEHVQTIWDQQFTDCSEAKIRSWSPQIQISFRTTRMMDNYTLAKFGLFHPSVTHNQRVISTLIELADSPVCTTVVGRADRSVRRVSLKLYLSRSPSEILVTKDSTVQELRSHLALIWRDSLVVPDCSSPSTLSVSGLPSEDVPLSALTLPDPLLVTAASSPPVSSSISPHLELSHMTVIGKGTQQPFRVVLVRTMGTEDEIEGSSRRSEIVVFNDTTVLEVKKQVCTIWRDLDVDPSVQAAHVKYPVQVLFRSQDLTDDDALLASCGLLDESVPVKQRILVVRSTVHLLIHQGRFINLQRYIWNQGQSRGSKLSPISPLAAVSSVEELQRGILQQSNLSFTSKDCYRTYEEMAKIFPREAVEMASPYKFFKKRERITLQRSKEYEDFLKDHITRLSRDFPRETARLLDSFQVIDTPREFNLCDLVMELKQLDMLPCLPFHLNTFEAIKLFQQLLGDLEYRQKVAHPTYYLDLQAETERKKKENETQISAQGKNEKNIEEIEKTLEIVSDVDIFAPHPSFTACKGSPLSQQELDQLIADMERYDGFEKRDASAKGQNLSILRHALIRGLRRGIGLFIDEVSFPSYRRAIQRLASNGKLGVVISDSSLAFGVNMPFRSCVFCGEMRGSLDELMAQQMSGRAGRRGLDEQGHVIYAGFRVPMLRKIMIGKISNITGRKYPPKYETMFLQAILSPRHTGYARTEVIGGRTLSEFIDGVEGNNRYSMTTSKQIMLDLGFVAATQEKDYRPNFRVGATYGQLTAVWEMRNCIYESLTIGMLLNDIVEEFNPVISLLRVNEKRRNVEIMDPHVFSFFSILIQLIGRTPAKKHGVKLLDLHYFSHQHHRDLFDRWARKFEEQQRILDSKGFSHLKNPVPAGVELDGTFFQCAIDRNYVHSLDETLKQEMKQMIWHVGSVLLLLNKASHLEPHYNRVGHFLFRNAFEKLRYLNSELIASVIDFDNIAAAEAERRTDVKAVIPKLPQAMDWTDLNRSSWSAAILSILTDFQDAEEPVEISAIGAAVDSFLALDAQDLPFIQHCLTSRNIQTKSHIQGVIDTLLFKSSFISSFFRSDKPEDASKVKYLARLGLLIWYCTVCNKAALKIFHIYLRAMYEKLDEDDVEHFEAAALEWEGKSLREFCIYLPNFYKTNVVANEEALVNPELPVSEEVWCELKASSSSFLDFLKQEEEDEEEEEEDD